MSLSGLQPEVAREALAAYGEAARPRPDCPAPDEIWQAVQGTLAPPEAERVVEHVSGCLACTEAWDLTRDLAGAAAETADNLATERRSWTVWLGVAAVLLTALGLQQLGWLSPTIHRGGSDEIASAVAGETLPKDACFLMWSGPRQAESYVLELSWVFEQRFGELPAIETIPAMEGETSYLVAPELLAGVPTGADLLWALTALRGDEVIAEKAFTVRLE